MATTKTAAKPTVKVAAKPAAKTAAKPAAKPAVKVAAKTPAAKTPAAKTPAAKTPAAKTPAAKPVKLNQAVNVTRRNGSVAAGKVVKIEDKPNGRWVTVNVSLDRKNPELVTARASSVIAR